MIGHHYLSCVIRPVILLVNEQVVKNRHLLINIMFFHDKMHRHQTNAE